MPKPIQKSNLSIIFVALVTVLLVSACSGSISPQISPSPVPTDPSPTAAILATEVLPSQPVIDPSPTSEILATVVPISQSEISSTTGFQSAALIVEFAPTHRVVVPIEFTQPTNAIEALLSSGLEVVTADFGDSGLAVCSIGGLGCPADNCFCSDKFWSAESWIDGAWLPYQVGPSSIEIKPGAVEGWRWTQFGVSGLPPAPPILAAQDTIEWLAEQQDSNTGGYDSESSSVEVLLAIGANGLSAEEWLHQPGSPSLMAYWQTEASQYAADGPANAGKLAVGLAAAGSCWPADVMQPGDFLEAATTAYSPHAGFQAWGILGTLALSQTVSSDSLTALTDMVMADGGWEWNQGFGSDTNTTALVIQALIAAGVPADASSVQNALDYLKAAQNQDGGFPYAPDSQYGSESDSNSTAYAVQAILAAAQNPEADEWSVAGNSPIQYLMRMKTENGSLEWQPGAGENLVASAQAVAALLGRPYPFGSAALPACP